MDPAESLMDRVIAKHNISTSHFPSFSVFLLFVALFCVTVVDLLLLAYIYASKMGSPEEISASSAPAEVTSSTPDFLSGEKIAPITRTETPELEKSDLKIDDEAGALAVQALESGPVDAEASRKVLRKIDMYILPFLCITYGRGSLETSLQGHQLTMRQVYNSWTRQAWDIPVSSAS